MKIFTRSILAVLVALILVFSISSCTQCNPPHVHTFGDWIIRTEASLGAEGERYRICSGCSQEETEVIPALEAVYFITVIIDGKETKIPLLGDGVYQIDPAPEKIGYELLGFFDASGNSFPLSGTVNQSITVYAQYKILETNTFAQLKERIEAGSDILLAADIILEDTIYVSDSISISSNGSYTLKRADAFLGDLFIIGCYSNGSNPLLIGKKPSLTVTPGDTFKISFDGNKENVTEDVKGTLFLLTNSATINIYDGVEIFNFKLSLDHY